jgi:ATP-dependent helicase Lhr and Lhr-like helicase
MVDSLSMFAEPVRSWFQSVFESPTRAQAEGWSAIARGESTLILAPTGSGKTLAAFLSSLNTLMFSPAPVARDRCRVLYISPLKALAVDVDRNLRAPLAGIARAAESASIPFHTPVVALRTGDTPAAERARFQRTPGDILITTPESLYLLLTSNAREVLRSLETVIVDEIHALVPTKRGAHLALSLERLAHLTGRPLQRIGLSATQRPLDEVARFLGGSGRRGVSRRSSHGPKATQVTIVDASEPKRLHLRIEVPVEDLSKIGQVEPIASGPASSPARTSIWSAIHPRLLELIRSHRSTLLFVNSRRLAERLAAAINDLAGETVARSHHGSLAREQRVDIEDQLKAGTLPALVATSSLELGIDMGAIDLVVQIEAPPSVASGLQRIGRAGHQVGAASEGVIFPKFRGDLLACAAVARSMHDGRVEATRYPRNPLDVLAQQVVAMVSMDDWDVDELFAAVCQAAPFEGLNRSGFEGVLDMLSGRYPSDEFAELRPRITWDRVQSRLSARVGAKRLAVANAGTIPDRGLYGVFLATGEGRAVRVGELDEEMVFESRAGEVFVLGASSWRIEQITHDRVLVTPAPGQPGKTPFWKGEAPGRPIELGLEIGALTRDLARTSIPAALTRLTTHHSLEPGAAENLVRYVRDQAAAGALPDADTIVIERVRDELGDWRVCVLSPRGSRIHAPWCMAVVARIQQQLGLDVETLWSDDGMVIRFPDVDSPPDPQLMLPEPDEVEALVLRQLGSTALFAARFRENAGRALLLPKRRAGQRAPLWQQRKKATDLLAVASRFGSFPIVLETYRECLRDVFDMPALLETLRGVQQQKVKVKIVDPESPTPFASSLMFSYVANFLYDGDAPLAERRAQALSVDPAQLRELIGDTDLRDLLDESDIHALERDLQRVTEVRQARSADGLHDLLLEIGDLSNEELAARARPGVVAEAVPALQRARRIIEIPMAGTKRWVAVEDAARYRDALGVPLPAGLPAALLEHAPEAMIDLVSRYGRTHAPFTSLDVGARLGVGEGALAPAFAILQERGRLIHGEFTPGRREREWCDAGVLRQLRRRSVARLRREVEAVEPAALARFVINWQGIHVDRTGPDALLDVIEQLQGAPLPASLLESEILPARLPRYEPEWLDALAAAGEVIWVGIEPLGAADGRVALFLTDRARDLAPLPAPDEGLTHQQAKAFAFITNHGASFFAEIHEALGGGYPGDLVDTLWDLVWTGRLTNDAFHALRARVERPARRSRKAPVFRSRRLVPRAAEGRWALTPSGRGRPVSATVRMTAVARQLLARHGVLTREAVTAEHLPGGFSSIYPALKAMDDAGQVRRGYFVRGLGATQFALPGALELLRSRRDADPEVAEVRTLAATDPANPYGTTLPWTISGAMRVAGATVILVDGELSGYLSRGRRELRVDWTEEEPRRSRVGRALATALVELAAKGPEDRRGLAIAAINDSPSPDHPLAEWLTDAGFVRAGGLLQLAVRHA